MNGWTAPVTGSTDGIGMAIARTLAEIPSDSTTKATNTAASLSEADAARSRHRRP